MLEFVVFLLSVRRPMEKKELKSFHSFCVYFWCRVPICRCQKRTPSSEKGGRRRGKSYASVKNVPLIFRILALIVFVPPFIFLGTKATQRGSFAMLYSLVFYGKLLSPLASQKKDFFNFKFSEKIEKFSDDEHLPNAEEFYQR